MLLSKALYEKEKISKNIFEKYVNLFLLTLSNERLKVSSKTGEQTMACCTVLYDLQEPLNKKKK